MKNRINLNNFQIRTDLIIENDNLAAYDVDVSRVSDSLKVTSVYVNDKMCKHMNKKVGNYVTVEFEDITNFEDREEIKDVLVQELNKLLDKIDIKDNDSCLIIGLGNSSSTPDSLGPKVASKVLVTRHLFVIGTDVKKGIRNVAAFSPGVMASTGIETYDTIISLVKKIKPSFLIVVDALASMSIDRINRTIQITDTGIHPGSGVGNNRRELSSDTIGIPVIAIGVPTVVESSTIVNDTIDFLFKHISYIKNNSQANKLIFTHGKNYLDKIKDMDLSCEEKKKVSGILGELDSEQKRQLINEVLTNLNYNLIVTPKEIDFLIDNLSEVIIDSINHSLHREI